MTDVNPDQIGAGASQPLEWRDGDMPYSTAFGDHFYCQTDGRLECGHVFLAGNGLPDPRDAGAPHPMIFNIPFADVRESDYFSDAVLWALEKNVKAIRFYGRHGFTATGEKKLEDGTSEYLVLLKRKV